MENDKQKISGGGFDMSSKKYVGAVVALAVVLVIGLLYWYTKKFPSQMEGLDNRMRWPLGGLRDDTGSHNPLSVFGRGYGLDQTRTGAKVMQPDFDLALGKASLTTGGKTQTEYGPELGDAAGFQNPYQLMSQRPTRPSLKESLDKREKLEPKTTDKYLQSKLY